MRPARGGSAIGTKWLAAARLSHGWTWIGSPSLLGNERLRSEELSRAWALGPHPTPLWGLDPIEHPRIGVETAPVNANREVKLEQVLKLFSAGSYRVDPELVADSIVRRFSSPERTGRVCHREIGRARLRSVILAGAGSARTRAV